MKNLTFHGLLRWKMIVPPILTTPLICILLHRLGDCTFSALEWMIANQHWPFQNTQLMFVVRLLWGTNNYYSGSVKWNKSMVTWPASNCKAWTVWPRAVSSVHSVLCFYAFSGSKIMFISSSIFPVYCLPNDNAPEWKGSDVCDIWLGPYRVYPGCCHDSIMFCGLFFESHVVNLLLTLIFSQPDKWI